MQKLHIENKTIFRVLIAIAVFIYALRLFDVVLPILLWVGAAFFLSIALDMPVSFVAKYLPRKSRGAAIALILISFAILLGVLVYSFAPPLVNQSQQLIDSIPGAVQQVQDLRGPAGDFARHYNIGSHLQNASIDFTGYFSTATGSAVDVIKSVFSGVAAVITIFTLTFFMLLESPAWLKTFWRLQAPAIRKRNQKIAKDMYRAVTGYVNGNLFTSAIAGFTGAIAMWIVGLPFVIPLAVLIGILDLIPLVGATLAAVLVIIVALFKSVTAAIIMTIFFVVYQQIENNVLQPLVYGKSTELSPLVVTIAIVMGAAIAGIFGALVAIPIAACIKVLLVHRYGSKVDVESELKAEGIN